MITYKLYSNTGSREVNEDSVGQLEKDGSCCFVLADGLGGHGKGEVASSIAVETALKLFDEEGTTPAYPAELRLRPLTAAVIAAAAKKLLHALTADRSTASGQQRRFPNLFRHRSRSGSQHRSMNPCFLPE